MTKFMDVTECHPITNKLQTILLVVATVHLWQYLSGMILLAQYRVALASYLYSQSSLELKLKYKAEGLH